MSYLCRWHWPLLIFLNRVNSCLFFFLLFFYQCTGQCLPAGLLDISDCYYGFPIALSYPHFLDTDQKVFDQVEGVQPNRSDHESYFMIQPVSWFIWENTLIFVLFYFVTLKSVMLMLDVCSWLTLQKCCRVY